MACYDHRQWDIYRDVLIKRRLFRAAQVLPAHCWLFFKYLVKKAQALGVRQPK